MPTGDAGSATAAGGTRLGRPGAAGRSWRSEDQGASIMVKILSPGSFDAGDRTMLSRGSAAQKREPEHEDRAPVGIILDGNGTAVATRDLVDDREAEAGALDPRHITPPVEPLEDP